ncbi:MAG: EF-hand domain-containing protein [Bermanella sp.]
MLKMMINATLAASIALVSVQASAYSDNEGEDSGKRRGPPPFSELDLDGDASLTLEEFQQHQIPRGDHETIFNHIDADGDGVVTEDEMKNHKPPRRSRN